MAPWKDLHTRLQDLRHPNCPPWYLSVFPCLAALNQVEDITALYPIVLQEIDETEHLDVTRKIREALTKSVGIIGAAKTGNSLRSLANVVPSHLQDPINYRENVSQEMATRNGRDLVKKIYYKDPDVGRNATREAGPDYDYIVLNLFYGHIFSFMDILGILETEQVIVSALIGIDCMDQVQSHMRGMLRNGASRDDVEWIRDVCSLVVDIIGPKERCDIAIVPEVFD